MIETKGLRKSFQVGKGRKKTTVEAVRGVDLKVGGGEIFGFLGPNGAGKTTTLRMLTTLLIPDGGEAVIAGADLRKNPGRVRKLSGYVAQGGGRTILMSRTKRLQMPNEQGWQSAISIAF